MIEAKSLKKIAILHGEINYKKADNFYNDDIVWERMSNEFLNLAMKGETTRTFSKDFINAAANKYDISPREAAETMVLKLYIYGYYVQITHINADECEVVVSWWR